MIDEPLVERPIATSTKANHEVKAPRTVPTGTWFSRHSTLINFWLDLFLLVVFVVQAWMLTVLRFVFPRGSGPEWTIWGANSIDWSEALCMTYAVFTVGILLHVMFHWAWICAVISTRFLRRKATKDDGSQTLIGVALIVFIIHVVIAGLLIAKANMTGPH